MSATTSPAATPQADAGAAPFLSGWHEGWTTDRTLGVAEWGDANVILTSKDSAEPGPYRTSRTPACREASLSRRASGTR